MSSLVCKLENITFEAPYRDTAILNDISLEIHRGDFIVVVGSNGCGKSSLFKMINGLLKPTSGRLQFTDASLTTASLHHRSRSVSTLTQDINFSTFSDLTILENCVIALMRKHKTPRFLSKSKKRRLVYEHLAKYSSSLSKRLDTIVSHLSGGERQLLAFIISLWTNPQLLLLDEHTSALDPLMGKKLMELTNEVATGNQLTTLMISHDLNDALRYGNRLILMKDGKVVLDVKGTEKDSLTRNQLLTLFEN